MYSFAQPPREGRRSAVTKQFCPQQKGAGPLAREFDAEFHLPWRREATKAAPRPDRDARPSAAAPARAYAGPGGPRRVAGGCARARKPRGHPRAGTMRGKRVQEARGSEQSSTEREGERERERERERTREREREREREKVGEGRREKKTVEVRE